MSKVSVERKIGERVLRFETGEIARLASGAVVASYGDSVVLCSAMRSKPRPGLDFFPLQCDYREKLGAGGKFPGGFRKLRIVVGLWANPVARPCHGPAGRPG